MRTCLFSLQLFYLGTLFFSEAGFSQTPDYLRTLFSQKIGLSESEVSQLEQGKAVAKILHSPGNSQILMFGGIYIASDPGKYLNLASNLKRQKLLPGILAAQPFSNPPAQSDLSGFALSKGDVDELKKCEPGDCDLQLPAGSIEQFRKRIDWSATNPGAQVNDLAKEMTIKALMAYESKGNAALGPYQDKHDPIQVAKQFNSLVESARALSLDLPTLYSYILNYPRESLSNSSNLFYWENVDFGLKPTFRVIQQVTARMNLANAAVDVVAVKQLYATHYFETALDLYLCFPRSSDGFYLVTVNGSEQDGLTGVKGRVIRKRATDKSKSALESYLAATKRQLEQ